MERRLTRKGFAEWLEQKGKRKLKAGKCPLAHFLGLSDSGVGHTTYGDDGRKQLPGWAQAFIRKTDGIGWSVHDIPANEFAAILRTV